MASSINASTSGPGGVITTADNSGILNIQTAGTNALTINGSQQIGIGTTTPNSPLQIVNSTVGQVLTLTSSSTNIYGLATDGTISTYTGGVLTGSGGFVGTASAHPYIFRTNNTEVMRIDSSGNLLISTTTSTGATSGGWFLGKYAGGASGLVGHNSSAVTGDSFISFWVQGNLAGNISQQAGYTTNYGTSSDYRLKENIAPMTGALDKIKALKPVTYNWKVDVSAGQGFIAHELQDVVPDCVVGKKDAVNEDGSIKPQQIDTSFLVATLTAAIQELNAKVEAQAATITALQAKVGV